MKFYRKNQERQLKFNFKNQFNDKAENIDKSTFKNDFEHHKEKVINLIFNAHEDVLKELTLFPPNGNSVRSQLLNDRVQRMAKEEIPEILVKDKYNTICLKVSDKYLCLFKKIDESRIISFSETVRAIEKFSQYRRNNSKLSTAYVIIGYRLTPDFQSITEIWAIKTKIDAKEKVLKIDWKYCLYDQKLMVDSTEIQSNQDSFNNITEADTSEFPDIKIKSS